MNPSRQPIDARRYRDTVGLFGTGIAVIVGHAGDELFAMTANAVMSVSLEPMLITFCPGKKTQFAQHLSNLSGFSINFLRDGQQALSNYFAGGWKEPTPPPFRFVPSRCGSRLEGSLASIDCEPEQIVEVGDHWLVIGRVLDLHVGIPPHRPLLFFGGRYRTVLDAPSTPAPDLSNVQAEPARIFYDRWGDS
jgi:flavin reductase (DIM6/NTAB) family NADH-FMN oxidoreductase RutF